MTVQLTHFGHACVLAEIQTDGRTVRALFDPGTYSSGFDDLADLDLIFITHAHPDHLDLDKLPALVTRNPDVEVVADQDTANALLDGVGGAEVTRVVSAGERVTVGGIDVTVTGGNHADIHPALPPSSNTGFILDDTVFHPGDSFDAPPSEIDILLLPIGGPWMKIGEAIDYLREVAPRYVIPIHQAGLAAAHQHMHTGLITNLAPDGTQVRVLDAGVPQTITL